MQNSVRHQNNQLQQTPIKKSSTNIDSYKKLNSREMAEFMPQKRKDKTCKTPIPKKKFTSCQTVSTVIITLLLILSGLMIVFQDNTQNKKNKPKNLSSTQNTRATIAIICFALIPITPLLHCLRNRYTKSQTKSNQIPHNEVSSRRSNLYKPTLDTIIEVDENDDQIYDTQKAEQSHLISAVSCVKDEIEVIA